MNSIAAIVVTYNRKALLEECLNGLLNSNKKCDIVVVDNASTDGTQQFVEEKIKSDDCGDKIFYYNTGKNIGGAGGFNFGIKKAYQLGYEYFWLMDDDTIVQNDSLEELLKCDEILNGNYGFLSSRANWTDGTRCLMNYHTLDSDWEDDTDLLLKGLLRLKTATFVSFFVKRNIIEDVGLPIKEYFIWGDDTEFSQRISKKYNCYYCFNSVVVHKMKDNQSSKEFSQITDLNRIRRMKISIRNDMRTAKFSGTKSVLKMLLHIFKQIVKCLKRGCKYKGLKIRVLLSGMFAGLFFSAKPEYIK